MGLLALLGDHLFICASVKMYDGVMMDLITSNTHLAVSSPVLMALLPLLSLIPLSGETQVLAQVLSSAGNNSSTVGVLASSHKPAVPGGSDSWQAAVVIYNSDDNSTSTSTDDVTVSLKGLPAQQSRFNYILSASVVL